MTNRRIVAGFVLLVVLATLALDILALVAPCPYCRVQRAALGVLAILLLLLDTRALLSRYIGAVAGLYGLVVGISQNFNHVKKMNAGVFDWPGLWIGHPWLLSGLAVMALVWMLFLLFGMDGPSARQR